MANLPRSLIAHLDEVKRANRAVSLEMASIVSFFAGLFLVVMVVLFLAAQFVDVVMPENAEPSIDPGLFPKLAFGSMGIAIGALCFLIPAALLMSAGVVVRHFMEKT